MVTRSVDLNLELLSTERKNISEAEEAIIFQTNRGRNRAVFHSAKNSEIAIIWVFGAGGGLDGPAGGVYVKLAKQMTDKKVASLRLDYRYPGYLEDCIGDVLLAISYLKTINYSRFILVGHSFGGAVVISAGALSEEVVAVATLSSQTYGTNLVKELSPKPILLIHGKADEILAPVCSSDIYKRAKQPKEVIYYEGCKHGLDQCGAAGP